MLWKISTFYGSKKFSERNWVFATNWNFNLTVYTLRLFKLLLFDLTEFSLKLERSRTSGCTDTRITNKSLWQELNIFIKYYIIEDRSQIFIFKATKNTFGMAKLKPGNTLKSAWFQYFFYSKNLRSLDPWALWGRILNVIYFVWDLAWPQGTDGWSNFQKFTSNKIRFLKIWKSSIFFYNIREIFVHFCFTWYTQKEHVPLK